MILLAITEGPGQTAGMRRLILAFAVRIYPYTSLFYKKKHEVYRIPFMLVIDLFVTIDNRFIKSGFNAIPASILHKSIAGSYRPVRVADGPITARHRFM